MRQEYPPITKVTPGAGCEAGRREGNSEATSSYSGVQRPCVPNSGRGVDIFTIRDGKVAAKLAYVKG
jgi:hypothetical protein